MASSRSRSSPSPRGSGAKATRRPKVIAGFAASWDGRMTGHLEVEGVDAVVCHRAPLRLCVKIFGTGKVVGYATRNTAAAKRGMLVHLAPKWPLRDALEHLAKVHGIKRLGFAGEPGLFREFAAEGLLDELRVAWQPRIVGGAAKPPITGFEGRFLPCGISFQLLKLERSGEECTARYRVQPARP